MHIYSIGMANIIEVKNLKKEFGATKAVNDISFSVPEGEIFAFLGPNGAGKTTTIKMLTTILHPTSGEIRVGGFDPATQQAEVRKMFGIVFQDQSLDDELTAYENLDFHGVLYGVSKVDRKARIEKMLKFVDLWDRRDDQIKNFSGGMRRRVEIARGLIHEPRILYLDEPTLGLDPQTRNHIWSYVKELNKTKGMTVFFTTHHMEEVDKAATRVAIIDRGVIVETGTPEELKKKTNAQTLEEAFLSITGHAIREEEATGADRMRQHRRAWGRK